MMKFVKHQKLSKYTCIMQAKEQGLFCLQFINYKKSLCKQFTSFGEMILKLAL